MKSLTQPIAFGYRTYSGQCRSTAALPGQAEPAAANPHMAFRLAWPTWALPGTGMAKGACLPIQRHLLAAVPGDGGAEGLFGCVHTPEPA